MKAAGVRILFAILSGCVGLPVHASVDICVATASQLGNALITASHSDSVVAIKLQRGTYAVGGTGFDRGFSEFDDSSLSGIRLQGGYGPACATRTIDPVNTVISGAGVSGLLIWEVRGDVLFEGLTLNNFAGTLDLFGVRDNIDLIMRRIVVKGSTVASNSALSLTTIDGQDGAHFQVVDSVFANNAAPCALEITPVDGLDTAEGDVEVVHSTFANNAQRGLCARSLHHPKLYNNVSYGNGGASIWVRDAAPVMVKNIYGDYDGPSFFTGSSGNISGNPLFVNAGSGNYMLQTASPAINSADDAPPGGQPATDIDGGPRQIGSHADRGAFESAVDDSFFLDVTNNNDSGTGSLRQAMINANATSGLNIIRFNIPGNCPIGIGPDTLLPDITDSVIIDGYSQPGSSPNDLENGDNAVICIRIGGGNGNLSHAFYVPGTVPADTQLRLQGVGLGGFTGQTVSLYGGRNHAIYGNHFGPGLPSSALQANAENIWIGVGSSGNFIGGDDPSQRNVIGSAHLYGIYLEGEVISPNGLLETHDNTITNNFIGVARDGVTAAANGPAGVYVRGRSNTVVNNVISGNLGIGIVLQGTNATDNVISDNRIGMTALPLCLPQPCAPALGNMESGISMQGNAHDNIVRDNAIAYNGARGIQVSNGVHNALRGNAIHDNQGLGIDLGTNGVSLNDNDGGAIPVNTANFLINFPEVSDASNGHVTGIYRSINGSYRLEFFSVDDCDATGYGQGQRYVKSASVTIANAPAFGNGSVSFDVAMPATVAISGTHIAMTATDAFGDTSEFSQCVPYTGSVTLFANGFE